MLWSGLVSRVGASRRVNLIAPFPFRLNCPRKNYYVLRLANPMNSEEQNSLTKTLVCLFTFPRIISIPSTKQLDSEKDATLGSTLLYWVNLILQRLFPSITLSVIQASIRKTCFVISEELST